MKGEAPAHRPRLRSQRPIYEQALEVAQRKRGAAGKPLLLTVTVSRSALVQTLDHLADLDGDEEDDG